MSPGQVFDLIARARANTTVAAARARRVRIRRVLDRIVVSYRMASGLARSGAIYQGRPPRNTCRYCGKFWKRAVRSALDGHARCSVIEDFKAELTKYLASPHITVAMVSERLDVTSSVVRAWWLQARGEP